MLKKMCRRHTTNLRTFAILVSGGVIVAAICGCEGILNVDDPDVITTSDLEGSFGIDVLHAGALGDFAFAWTGGMGGAGQVGMGGLLADEWVAADYVYASGTGFDAVDRREVRTDGWTGDYPYSSLHRARTALERSAAAISAESPNAAEEPRISELFSLAGYAYIAFGENYCSGVPFSAAPETGEFQFGDPKTTSEIFEIALDRFGQARGNTAGDPDMEYLAAVGMARALLNIGEYDAAAAEATGVPTSFSYVTEHSDNSLYERNAVYYMNVMQERLSLAESEGGNGLPFRSANDPRVPWTRTENGNDLGQDWSTPQYDLLKYTGVDASVVLADGIEARLIEAEALLRSDDTPGWLEIINQLRADAGMANAADPGGDVARVDLHFSERAFWMFATGHRLGDLRRLVRQYGRAPESVFPAGAYHRGGAYGTDANLPIPDSENVNPDFQGCLNRNP